MMTERNKGTTRTGETNGETKRGTKDDNKRGVLSFALSFN